MEGGGDVKLHLNKKYVFTKYPVVCIKLTKVHLMLNVCGVIEGEEGGAKPMLWNPVTAH